MTSLEKEHAHDQQKSYTNTAEPNFFREGKSGSICCQGIGTDVATTINLKKLQSPPPTPTNLCSMLRLSKLAPYFDVLYGSVWIV